MAAGYGTLPIGKVRITGGFWASRQRLMTEVTIPYMERILRDETPGANSSHALANLRIAAGLEAGEHRGMVFQDSDVYKWLEAAAYSLSLKPDPALARRLDETVRLIVRAQRGDGYLNSYFQLSEPGKEWTNLFECHELYCAGHLMEAAAACAEIGRPELLGVAEKLAAHIIRRFGPDGEVGLPGHQEIEIGLMRLYAATGKREYLRMAARFLDERGKDPAYFLKHTPPHPGLHYGGYDLDPGDAAYNQSYAPVRRQREARGHAVRCLYMLTAMAEIARETKDKELQSACEAMLDSIEYKRMYVTGGVGSSARGESFTEDFDLPNDSGYAETCASVAMVFFAQRMLLLSPKGRYADLLERALFNGALSGMQLDGQRFFYVNPLSVDPARSGVEPGLKHVLPRRPSWHACACCPTNLARLIASLGKYLFSEGEETLYSHLPADCELESAFGRFRLTSAYPWEGEAEYRALSCAPAPFALAVHIPGYAPSFEAWLNGEKLDAPLRDGYLYVRRAWHEGDRLRVSFPMNCRRLYADPRVKADKGLVALARGPLVYCLESADNFAPLGALRLPPDAAVRAEPYDSALLDGIVPLSAPGLIDTPDGPRPFPLRAVPYYAWSNRSPGEMRVWIREGERED